METSIILISTVVLLVLLFLKVPVFISILSGSMAYFLPDRRSLYKDIGPESSGRRREHTSAGDSVFYLCRRVYELFRRNQAGYGIL